MSAADGVIVGTTKLVDHGPDSARWNLVLLAEGYQQAELPKFHTDADAFVTRLFSTAPYTELWCALNVHRVDVASTDSGADDTAGCTDGPPGTGTGATVNTYFDARFCLDGSTRRLLGGDENLANDTAKAQVPATSAVVVIVNTAEYGGSGGLVAWASTKAQAGEIAIHELGHSAFALGDEYGDIYNMYAGGEPDELNLTMDTNRATTRWASLIRAGTPVPTLTNPDCTTENPAPSPVPAGTVGLFEGGNRYHCGLFHAEYACRMRALGNAFCAVCTDRIRATLRQHLPVASGPVRGTQFTGTLAPRQTHQWFTHDWPACWHVIWTVGTTTPVTPGPGIAWHVRVERATRETITYWIEITNLTATSLDIEARYAVAAKD